MPGYESTIVEAQSDGTAVTATGVGSLLPASCKIPLRGGYLYRIGHRLLVRATGRMSNIATTPGTLTLRWMMGAVIASASTAIPLNTTVKTNVAWFLDLGLTVRSVGTAATIFGQGSFQSESVLGGAATVNASAVMWQQSAPAVGTAFDSTVANIIDLTAQFSLTGNSIQLHTFGLEDLTTTP